MHDTMFTVTISYLTNHRLAALSKFPHIDPRVPPVPLEEAEDDS
jgi:hypothetical protein